MKSDSPLQNSEILKKTLAAAKTEYGEKETESMKRKSEFLLRTNDYEVDIEEELGTNKSKLNLDIFTQHLKNTKHLPEFNLFEHDLGIDGDSYLPVKKCLFYYQNSIVQDTFSYKINYKTRVDNRINLLIISSAGTGKSTIKNSNKRVMKVVDDDMGLIEVSGISHPEQLVGKIIYKGKGINKEAVEVKGLMGYKCVMNDESQDMLNEKNDVYAKSQRIKRLAMDNYGENKISKKLVADNPEDILEYYSPSRVCDFAHPKKLESPFFDTGSFRRYFAFNVSYDTEMSLSNITDFNFDGDDFKKNNWINFLSKNYLKQVKNIKFNKETLKIIEHYHKCLLIYLLKHKNQNAFRYGLQTRYSLRSTFCKNVLILAAAKKEITPSFATTIYACKDTLLFVLKSIETYNELGNMGTSSDVWGGVSEEDAQAMEYLYRKGALSRESSDVSIKKFQTILANFYGCKPTQSRKHHYKLKRDGFIDSDQVFRDDTRVWLKYIPKEIKLNFEGFEPLAFWNQYLTKKSQGVTAKNTLLTPCFRAFIDDKKFQESQGVTGVGLMGCVLIGVGVNTQFKNNNNNNIYIYKRHPQIVSPVSPYEKNKTIATIKLKKQGVKHTENLVTPWKSESTRDVHYSKAKECENIKPTHTKKEILEYYKQNPKAQIQELYEKFGANVLILKKGGLIK